MPVHKALLGGPVPRPQIEADDDRLLRATSSRWTARSPSPFRGGSSPTRGRSGDTRSLMPERTGGRSITRFHLGHRPQTGRQGARHDRLGKTVPDHAASFRRRAGAGAGVPAPQSSRKDRGQHHGRQGAGRLLLERQHHRRPFVFLESTNQGARGREPGYRERIHRRNESERRRWQYRRVCQRSPAGGRIRKRPERSDRSSLKRNNIGGGKERIEIYLKGRIAEATGETTKDRLSSHCA